MKSALYVLGVVGVIGSLSGCNPDVNTVYSSAPKIEQVHPTRQHTLVVPESLTWSVVGIDGVPHFAITLEEQVALFRFMESVVIYKRESEEMLCFYGNPTECEKLNKLKDDKHDESRVREERNQSSNQ